MGAAMARRRPKAKTAQKQMLAKRDEATKKYEQDRKEHSKKSAKKSKG